jgi:hypothetical protein
MISLPGFLLVIIGADLELACFGVFDLALATQIAACLSHINLEPE